MAGSGLSQVVEQSDSMITALLDCLGHLGYLCRGAKEILIRIEQEIVKTGHMDDISKRFMLESKARLEWAMEIAEKNDAK